MLKSQRAFGDDVLICVHCALICPYKRGMEAQRSCWNVLHLMWGLFEIEQFSLKQFQHDTTNLKYHTLFRITSTKQFIWTFLSHIMVRVSDWMDLWNVFKCQCRRQHLYPLCGTAEASLQSAAMLLRVSAPTALILMPLQWSTSCC